MLTIGVLGSTGMLGSMVYRYLKNRGHNVVGFSRTEIEGYTDKHFDVFNNSTIDNLFLWINGTKVDAVINCIGLLVNESENDPAKAIYLNSYFPHLLERWTKDTNTKIIHISTDCIFDGKNYYGYNENDIPTETNWYGRSKALGELNNKKDLTFRQSIIGPAIEDNNSGLFNWTCNQKGKSIKGYSNTIWNGITTLELVKNIERVLVNQPELSGIYHLVPEKTISKYYLLKLINKIWKLDITIDQYFNTCNYKVLKNNRNDFPVQILDYEDQLIELYTYMNKYNIKVGSLK